MGGVRLAPCTLRLAAQPDARELGARSAPSARGCCAALARSEASRACASALEAEQVTSNTYPLLCPGGRGAAWAFECEALILVQVLVHACEQAANYLWPFLSKIG